jgi:hypothetical protein
MIEKPPKHLRPVAKRVRRSPSMASHSLIATAHLAQGRKPPSSHRAASRSRVCVVSWTWMSTRRLKASAHPRCILTGDIDRACKAKNIQMP